MRNTGRVLVIFFILTAFLLAPSICIIPAKANPLTTVTLGLQEDPPHVDVSPGSSGLVEMQGWVKCVKYGPDQVKVFLEAQCDVGGASVIPPSMVFSGATWSEQTENFNVTTKVPQGYPCAATPQITVGGHYEQGGMQYQIEPVSQIIIIEQYFGIEASCRDGGELTCEPGEIIGLKISTGNTGNGEDTFLVDIENRALLKDKGFKLNDPVEINMQESEYKPVTLLVDIPQQITGNHAVHLIIISQGSEDSDFVCKQRLTINLEIVENNTFGSTTSNEQSFRIDYLILLFVVILIAAASSIVAVSYMREQRAIRNARIELPYESHFRYTVYPEPKQF